MADLFRLAGLYEASSALPLQTSGNPIIPADFDERLLLDKKHYDEPTLATDAWTVVSLGGLTNVHALVVKSAAKVKVRLTSADGSQQIIPVDSFFAVITEATPFTAIDLQRETGILTSVRLFLGEKAA